jgi:hypothetical protein
MHGNVCMHVSIMYAAYCHVCMVHACVYVSTMNVCVHRKGYCKGTHRVSKARSSTGTMDQEM